MKVYNLLIIESRMTMDKTYIMSDSKNDIEFASNLFETLLPIEKVVSNDEEFTGIEFFYHRMEESETLHISSDYDRDVMIYPIVGENLSVLVDCDDNMSWVINSDIKRISERF